MLLAAFVLLAGAMGGTAPGRVIAATVNAGCDQDDGTAPGDCGSHVTAPAPVALLQGMSRQDGKAAPGSAGADPLTLPTDGVRLAHIAPDMARRGFAEAQPTPCTNGLVAQPRGPPSRA
jgi:hypothetical protein